MSGPAFARLGMSNLSTARLNERAYPGTTILVRDRPLKEYRLGGLVSDEAKQRQPSELLHCWNLSLRRGSAGEPNSYQVVGRRCLAKGELATDTGWQPSIERFL